MDGIKEGDHMILQKKRQDLQGMVASLLILLGIVYAWLCFACVLRQGHVSEDDYVRMTQEIVVQSTQTDRQTAREHPVRQIREVAP